MLTSQNVSRFLQTCTVCFIAEIVPGGLETDSERVQWGGGGGTHLDLTLSLRPLRGHAQEASVLQVPPEA